MLIETVVIASVFIGVALILVASVLLLERMG
ncbi:hypothetical protein [[Enterobacter] lignolyticus]|nr:hypothetical protein [[Enterobacter] lignolyticus]